MRLLPYLMCRRWNAMNSELARPRDSKERAAQWTELLRGPRRAHLRLEPMPPGDVVAMVCKKLGVATMPALQMVVAGITEDNVDYLCKAIATVIEAT